ncbi:hypothetical protein AKG11_14220 [Shinella sp. SUS2]|nr:hypothetical protein AKG11_14220 [Shinella sp. SUS2]KOC75364.1 hypothetical protein AKG10_12800 [Shinella sp. GWS1]MDC7266242.1 hypothetical protein [Shinella sp. HY16]MDC7273139.1 hypothetical protein [Shinella sp. YZ44]
MTPEEARKDHWHMLRFMMLHALVGGLIGAATAAAVILLDIGGIGTRIARAADPVMPVLLLVVPFASLFGGAATASAILLMPYEKKYKD